jgi:hypothetical protein
MLKNTHRTIAAVCAAVALGALASTAGAAITAYDNLASSANVGYGNADLNATYGIGLTPATSGTLDALSFAVYNPSSGTGSISSATLTFGFYTDTAVNSNTYFGSFTTNLTLSNPLPVGYYEEFTVSSLDSLGIVIPSAAITVTQGYSNVTGGATKIGVVSFNPDSVVTSLGLLYIDSTAVSGSPAYYSFGTTPFRMGLDLQVSVPEASGLAFLAPAGLLLGRRRRA